MDSVLSCTAAGVRFEFKREPYGFTVRFHRHFGKEWDVATTNVVFLFILQPLVLPRGGMSETLQCRAPFTETIMTYRREDFKNWSFARRYSREERAPFRVLL